MITHNNSFVGGLGKLKNIGGSRTYTTPNTVNVEPEYVISTDILNICAFVACSLNGRLWAYKRSRRCYILVLRWDAEKEKLAFATSFVLNNENVIAYGWDWLLTDKSVLKSCEDEPYFSSVNISGNSFNYIDNCMSFFHEFLLWDNLHVHIPLHILDAPAEDITLLATPLEFLYSTNNNTIYSSLSSFIKILCDNSQCWGKSSRYIGRILFLPRTMSINNEASDFYLYLCSDFLRPYDKSTKTFCDDTVWRSYYCIPANEDSCYIFQAEKISPFVLKPVNRSLKLHNATSDHLSDLSDLEGNFFFDELNVRTIILQDNNELKILPDDKTFKATNLIQWCTPGKSLEATLDTTIFSSVDNATLAVHIMNDLHREFLQRKNLPFSIDIYNGSRVSLGSNDTDEGKVISVNSLITQNVLHAANTPSWLQLYKPCFSFSVISKIEHDTSYYPIDENPLVFYYTTDNWLDYQIIETDRTYTGETVYDWWNGCTINVIESITYDVVEVDRGQAMGRNSISFAYYFIDLETGQNTPVTSIEVKLDKPTLERYDMVKNIAHSFNDTYVYPVLLHCIYSPLYESIDDYSINSFPDIEIEITTTTSEIPYNEKVLDDIWGGTIKEASRTETIHANIPDTMATGADEYGNSGWRLVDDSIKQVLVFSGWEEKGSNTFAVFTYRATNTKFFLDVSSTSFLDNIRFLEQGSCDFYNPDFISHNDNGDIIVLKCRHLIHVYIKGGYYRTLLLESTYNPDIFNFCTELERSIIS